MTTALQLIKRSMRLAGVYSLGEEPSAEESEAGLAALNGMVESWANSPLMIYCKTLDSIPLVAGTASYTLGATGTVVTTRPQSILNSSYVEYQGVSYSTDKLTIDQYNQIGLKTQTGIPNGLWYESNYPDGTLTVWPVPDLAYTLKLWSYKPLTSFTDLTTVAALPPGYDDLIAFNLAVTFGPEFDGANIPPSVVAEARNLKRSIKRNNSTVPQLTMPIQQQAVGSNWIA